MRDEIKALLVRHAEWQRHRSRLSWEEKLRQAVAMRESLRSYVRIGSVAGHSGQTPAESNRTAAARRPARPGS
ncbi:MAG: hypothetical protein JXR77_01210 [Lentisphaeria bacterium]|nr:hypothetical protein [Lentisphaeria bacterium]